MSRMIGVRFGIFFLIALGALSSLYAATPNNIYIAQNSAGASNGAGCADAYPVTWFNNSANWGNGSNQIGPGKTVHLCGTITTELTFQGSGSSGSPIDLLFETGASVQISPGEDANGAIGLGSNNFIVIDGGAGRPCGWDTATNASEGTCNGQIENMLYGSSDATCPGGACTTQATATSLITGSGSNIEIRDLNVGPSYIHTSTGNGGNDVGGTGCISLLNGSNWNIHDNKLHDGSWCVTLTPTGSGSYSNWTIANNELYNNSHMVAIAGYGASSLNGLTMSGNYTHDMHNWDTTTYKWHANSIHIFGCCSSTYSNVTVNNNIMGGWGGLDVTAHIFAEQVASMTNFHIFNNLMYWNGNTSGRLIFLEECDSGCYIFNNTLSADNNTAIQLGGPTNPVGGINVENNFITNAFTLFDIETGPITFGTLDHQVYGANTGNAWKYQGGFTSSFATWKTETREGLFSTYAPSGVGLNSNYMLQAASPAIGMGANLSNLGITALSSDLAGAPRSASGPWDIGAYNYGSNSGSTIQPPTGVTATAQ